jgi:glycosyltransferase involved in cell wall biosynthesis
VPLLLSASRLAREKRIADLVAVLAACGRPDAVLAFAGSGPEEAELRAAVERAGLAARVRFAGQLDVPALADAFAAADVIVSASRSETQGLALCEAAAAGRVVVAPDRGGYAEVLGHEIGGVFPGPAPEPEALGRAIGRVLGDAALRSRLAAAARERAAAAWSAPAVAAALRAAYADAAAMPE